MNTYLSRNICCFILLYAMHSTAMASEANHKVKRSNSISVALPSSIPPYALKSQQSGLIPQLLDLVFNKMGYIAQYTYLPNKRVVKAFSYNQYDAAFSVPQPENESRIYYSHTIFDFQNIAVTLKANKIDLTHISDLADKRIAAFQNATRFLGYEYNQAIKKSSFYTEFNDQHEQLKLLIKKRADVIVLEKRIFEYYFEKLNVDAVLEEMFDIRPIFASSPRYMAFHSTKVRREFNAALLEIKKSKSYQKLFKVSDF